MCNLRCNVPEFFLARYGVKLWLKVQSYNSKGKKIKCMRNLPLLSQVPQTQWHSQWKQCFFFSFSALTSKSIILANPMSSKGNTDIGAETHLWKQRHILIFADCLTFNFERLLPTIQSKQSSKILEKSRIAECNPVTHVLYKCVEASNFFLLLWPSFSTGLLSIRKGGGTFRF